MSERGPNPLKDPFFIGVWAFFVPLGLVLSWIYMPEGWGAVQRVAVGLLGGAFAALILTANRLLGAYITKE